MYPNRPAPFQARRRSSSLSTQRLTSNCELERMVANGRSDAKLYTSSGRAPKQSAAAAFPPIRKVSRSRTERKKNNEPASRPLNIHPNTALSQKAKPQQNAAVVRNLSLPR